jgi:hypothetical protein
MDKTQYINAFKEELTLLPFFCNINLYLPSDGRLPYVTLRPLLSNHTLYFWGGFVKS